MVDRTIDAAVAASAEAAAAPDPETDEPAAGRGIDWWAVVTAPTGEGSVEAYLEHPLNLGRSPAWARVIRGLTGLAQALGVESLALAVVDIVAGAIAVVGGRKGGGAPA